MKKTTKKVFCRDCKYEKDYDCHYPKNMVDDSYAPKHTKNQHAEYINQNNDCKWFKEYEPLI